MSCFRLTANSNCSPIHLRLFQSVWAHWYAVHWHMIAAFNSYSPYLAQILGFWVTYVAKIMSLYHGWGWEPPQTASCIHLRYYKVITFHRHTIVALHSYTHLTWLRFWGTWSPVELKWCNYVKVDADSHLKLLSASLLDINRCLSTLICCQLVYSSNPK